MLLQGDEGAGSELVRFLVGHKSLVDSSAVVSMAQFLGFASGLGEKLLQNRGHTERLGKNHVHQQRVAARRDFAPVQHQLL